MTENVSGECGYKAFYNNKTAEIYASSLYEAKKKAIEHFKPKKSDHWKVDVVLCERPDGSTVTHSTAGL